MYQALLPGLDERMRRQWAAAEAKGLGRGGVCLVSQATGLSRMTIGVGSASWNCRRTNGTGRSTASVGPAADAGR